MSDDAPVADPGSIVSVLQELGVGIDEVEHAAADGTLELLLIERIIVPEPPHLDVVAVAARTGLQVDEVRRLWRSLGFPDPRPGDPVFGELDVEILTNVSTLLDLGVLTTEAVMQMSRVIGSSVARIAQSQVDAVAATAAGDGSEDLIRLEPLAANAGALLPTVPMVLENVWRRHLQAAARRRLGRGAASQEQQLVVGFADLVGFTALSQQVSDAELAAIVDLFESLTYDVITTEGGRVVKTIGDEVMFVVEGPAAAAEIALALADASREADQLSDVRVGMAMGPVLEREGDLFGPTVNLASRATTIAYPGTVVASVELHDALADDVQYVWRAMRPRYLKHIGRVQLWVLRRASEGFESRFAERRRALRDAVRARVETAIPALRSDDEEE